MPDIFEITFIGISLWTMWEFFRLLEEHEKMESKEK